MALGLEAGRYSALRRGRSFVLVLVIYPSVNLHNARSSW
jgi:hypothetical protein